jgi:hypothetical protein
MGYDVDYADAGADDSFSSAYVRSGILDTVKVLLVLQDIREINLP